MLDLAQAGKSYFGHPLTDDEFKALAEAGLVQRGAPADADQTVGKSGLLDPARASQPLYGGIDPRLQAEANLEGQRFAMRQRAEQPHQEIPEGNVFGAPLGALGMATEVPGTPTDYRGMLANEGIALGNRNALNDYARMQALHESQAAYDAAGYPAQHAAAAPFGLVDAPRANMEPPALSPAEEDARSRARGDEIRDTLMLSNPLTGPAYGAWTAADIASRIPGQVREGDYRNALLGAGAAAMMGAGVRPGRAGIERAAEDMVSGTRPVLDAAGNPAYRPALPWETREAIQAAGGRVRMGPDGQPLTQTAMQNGYPVESPMWEVPATRTNGGQLNIFAGPKAATADKNALLTAMGMDASKQSPEAIWNSTGWFRGADGKWRFEIPDDDARVLGGVRTIGDTTYSTAIDHPGYADAYGSKFEQPAVGLMWAKDLPTQGGYVPSAGKPGDTYYAPPRIAATAPDAATARSVNLHELQHHVQRLEDFAVGSNVKSGGYINYQRAAGEVEARNVQERAGMTPEQRRAAPPWMTEDVPRDEQIVHRPNGSTTLGTFVGVPFGPERERAIAMRMMGASNPDIYRETGATFGPEGALVREISDAGATVNPQAIQHGFQGTFGDVLNHPAAYEAMPGIEKTPVTMAADRDFRSNMNGSARLNIKGANADPAHVRKDMLGFLQYASGKRNNLAAGSGYQGGTQQLSDTIGGLERLQQQFGRDGASPEARHAVGDYLNHLYSLRSDYAKGLTTGDPAQSTLLAASREKSKDVARRLDHAFYDLSAGGYTKRIAGQHSETPQNALTYPWASGQLRNEPDFEKMVVLPNGEAVRSPIDLLNFALNWAQHRGSR